MGDITSRGQFGVERMAIVGDLADSPQHLDLPAELLDRWTRVSGPLSRTVIVARQGTTIVGAAITARRSLASYLKVSDIWVDAPANSAAAVEDALATEAEQIAWESGAIVVKRECQAAGLPLRPGYVRVEAPEITEPVPDAVTAVPEAHFLWRTRTARTTVPYMRQTSDFTCGGASLSMALAQAGRIDRLSRTIELDIWREATTILACDPFGLALAASARGLTPTVTTSTDETLFLENVETEHEIDLRRYIQSSFREQSRYSGIQSSLHPFSVEDLAAVIRAGGAAIVLVDELLVHGQECPHWILVHGMEGDIFLAHDPWTEPSMGESWVDSYDLPLPPSALDQIAWTGSPRYRAMLTFNP